MNPHRIATLTALQNANFTNAKLEGPTFEGADRRNAIGLPRQK